MNRVPAPSQVTIEIEHRHLPPAMILNRFRQDLPNSGRDIGLRLRRRGTLALVVAATSMLLPRLGVFRLRHGG